MPLSITWFFFCFDLPLTLKELLYSSVSTLLEVAARPLPEPFDPVLDLPQVIPYCLCSCLQVHAFNVLQAIFHDTHLGAGAAPLAATGVVLAIRGFGSPSWAVRNACTLLFGALVTRMLGCKRVKEDSSRVNSITASQCFSR